MERFRRVLIANRGEIAIRIARAVEAAGLTAVMLYATDDAEAPHVRAAEEAVALPGVGPAAYLDIRAVLAAAREARAGAVHPGYGFLSENAAFARACADAGLTFVGPSPEALDGLGDKASARALAEELGIPTLEGTAGGIDEAAAAGFLAGLPSGAAMMLKAVAGGGGRGMRVVRNLDELPAAFVAAGREANAAFGSDALYAERLMQQARHIEIQVVGDGVRALALGDRDCSLQRRRQKLIEIAPAPNLPAGLHDALFTASERMAQAVAYRTLATFEFLVDAETGAYAFMEANPRLQVEHTVTEEVIDVDLVRVQLALAGGASLEEAGVGVRPEPRGVAIQARVNLETLGDDGSAQPTGGLLTVYEPPSGPGVRVDGCGYAGYRTSPRYDPLLAKVIARGPSLAEAAGRAERALAEFRIGGTETNIPILRVLLRDATVLAGGATTTFFDGAAATLNAVAKALPKRSAGVAQAAEAPSAGLETVDGAVAASAPLAATVSVIAVVEGDLVRAGQEIAVLEAMKMEHVVTAPVAGRVVKLSAQPGEIVASGRPLLFIAPEDVDADEQGAATPLDLDHIRPDLSEVAERWRLTRDEARPDAVVRRRKIAFRTARENIDDLLDPGSFREFGAFAVAAQRSRRSVDDLVKISPADGLICGLGAVNGALFGPERARCAALAYDYTVFAGTQGQWNHAKTDRLLGVVEQHHLPLVWFVEGGGGRPGDTDGGVRASLNVPTFADYGRLAGLTAKIAVVNGYCFAGNASIAGMSEILIATKGSNLGMAGPAMIEGGGLGVYDPKDIGPVEEQAALGVVDILAEDEAEATKLAKQALGYTQGRLADFKAADQRKLRHAVPENRLRVYDVRAVIDTLFDTGSFLELRRAFAPGLIAGFARVEGRPVGVIANDPRVLGGAVDCDGSDKASRLLQLCDAFDLPVVSLVDTPGFMVGPQSERQAAVRKTSRLFIHGANLSTPIFAVVLRKAYGLGAMAMTGGGLADPMFTVSWPTGEFGGMGLEGAVRLAYRRELEAAPDPAAKKALYDERVAQLYSQGKAVEQAAVLQVDAVIDPADTRRWLASGLAAAGPRKPRRKIVDAW